MAETKTPALNHDIVEEKIDLSQVEEAGADEGFTAAEQKAIIRRVDRRLIVTTGIMFCCCLMDRNNLGAASIAGMATDLKLIEYRYSIIALVFFITYVLVQPVANILCRKLGPRYFMTFITVTWGVCILCFGFPNTWGPLVALRLILGGLEGGFFPACVYLISTWYTRYEVQTRFAGFYLLGSLASALAGVLAYGLMQMDGVGGYEGWRWIFIMEGIITILVGIIGYLFLVDFPDRAASTTWGFLTERECQFILNRIKRDRDDADLAPFNLSKFLRAGLDFKIWGFAFLFFLNGTVAYAIAFFLPIILRHNIGFSLAASQCLVAPPYAFAAILMYTTALAGDRWHFRGPVVAFNAVIALIGLPILGFAGNNAARYVGIFLGTAGITANFPAIMAYQANNVRGQWKRAFSSASLVGLGSIGGIAGSLVFRSQDAPGYRPGMWAVIVCNILILVTVAVMTIYFRICNRKVDNGTLLIEGLAGFKYTI